VVHALETSRLSPRHLTLEITESVLVSDVEAMSARLRELVRPAARRRAMAELLAKSLADGGFYLAAAQPVGSLSEVG
jgi:hypothetical protein